MLLSPLKKCNDVKIKNGPVQRFSIKGFFKFSNIFLDFAFSAMFFLWDGGSVIFQYFGLWGGALRIGNISDKTRNFENFSFQLIKHLYNKELYLRYKSKV